MPLAVVTPLTDGCCLTMHRMLVERTAGPSWLRAVGMTKFKMVPQFSSAIGIGRSERFSTGAADSPAALSSTSVRSKEALALPFVIPTSQAVRWDLRHPFPIHAALPNVRACVSSARETCMKLPPTFNPTGTVRGSVVRDLRFPFPTRSPQHLFSTQRQSAGDRNELVAGSYPLLPKPLSEDAADSGHQRTAAGKKDPVDLATAHTRVLQQRIDTPLNGCAARRRSNLQTPRA